MSEPPYKRKRLERGPPSIRNIDVVQASLNNPIAKELKNNLQKHIEFHNLFNVLLDKQIAIIQGTDRKNKTKAFTMKRAYTMVHDDIEKTYPTNLHLMDQMTKCLALQELVIYTPLRKQWNELLTYKD